MTTNPVPILQVAVGRLSPNPHNPRTSVSAEYISELAASLRQPHGQITPLVVRPAWCVGLEHAEALAAARPEREIDFELRQFEIVSGHCRHLAAKEAGLDSLACIVKELTDPEAEELNLAEQIQRSELTPRQEGQAFARQLSFRNADGSPRHTADSLGGAIGKSKHYVYQRISLNKLTGAAAKALDEGRLSTRIAYALARIPDEQARAAALPEILKGNGGEPMTVKQAEAFIAEHYMRELKGAPFDQTDATLVRHLPQFSPHTACSDCPFRTGNNRELFGDVKRGDICTRPACFEAKVAAAREQLAAAATKEGKRVLSAAECAKIYPPHMPVGMMDYSSPLVPLDEEPAAHLLKAVVKNPPSWGELVRKLDRKGFKPEVIVAFDQRGQAVECVALAPVMAAAEKAGEPIFRGKDEAPAKQDDEFKARQKEEAEKGKLRTAIAHNALTEMLDAAPQILINPGGFMKALLTIALENLGSEGAQFIVKWQGLKQDAGAVGAYDAVVKWVKSRNGPDQADVAPLLLVAEKMRWHGIETKGVQELAAALKVDLKATEKRVTAAFKAAKKPKSGPTKPAKPGKRAKAKRTPPERTIKRKPKSDPGAKAVAAVKSTLKAKKAGGS